MLKLEFPDEKHKLAYLKTINEWKKVEETPTSPWRFFAWENFEDFLSIVKNDVNNNENWVNSHLFFLVKDNEILWGIHVRHTIKHPRLMEDWWHIWYWIAPKHRIKWYATKMLELWLIEAKKIWLKEVLITCNIDNIWSSKVMEKNWWIFERLSKDWTKKRYWIKL